VLEVSRLVDDAALLAGNVRPDLVDALPSPSISIAFLATELPNTREVFLSERRISAVERSSAPTMASFTSGELAPPWWP
jgi:hypothetical protein